jgi:phenylpyruvate tautomerase PptA (4-oxalocrotonate tautomerase family)
MREAALHLPEIDNAPARLIASITDAMVAVFAEPVRKQVTVLVIGIPTGRSGVAGEAV